VFGVTAASRNTRFQATFAPADRASFAWRLPLLDHLGTREKRRWHIDSERLGGFEIDHQLELGWPLDWQLTGLFAFENPGDVNAGSARCVRNAGRIADQAAGEGG
jgi:hypothetical protein